MVERIAVNVIYERCNVGNRMSLGTRLASVVVEKILVALRQNDTVQRYIFEHA